MTLMPEAFYLCLFINFINGELLAANCQDKKAPIGCIAQSLIPSDGTFWIQFKDPEQKAENCFLTCQTVFPESSLALVYLDNEAGSNSLECHCAASSALEQGVEGPDVFCSHTCQLEDEDILCGGKHQFTYDGGFDIFYSVYCLNSTFEIPSTSTQLPSSTSNLVPTVLSTISSTTTQTVSSTEKPPNDVLKDILDMLVSANVINIIMIGLLIMINLLVIVLVVWCFLFLESQDPNASARFYNPKQNTDNNYGSTNEAFDPQPEMDDISHGTYVNTAAETMANSLKLTISHGSGTEEETEEETTPRPEEFITREGRSTFYYGDHIDSVSTASTEEVKSTVEELDKKDQKNGFE